MHPKHHHQSNKFLLGVVYECLRIQIAAAPVKEATVSTKHPVTLAVLILAEEQR